MADPYYTYNEEEEATPRRSNRKLFIGLIIGLLIGGVMGYTLGSQNPIRLESVDLAATPSVFISINAIIIFLLFIFLLVSRFKRSSANQYQGDANSKKIIVLTIGLFVLFLAGIYLFISS